MIFRKLFLIGLLVASHLTFAQEVYTATFLRNAEGGAMQFCSDNKQIIINLFGSNFVEAKSESGNIGANKYFITVDNVLVHAALIPLPSNIKEHYGVDNLSLETQKQILSGYLDYEINYMNSDQNTTVRDIYFAEGEMEQRKYYIWNYSYTNYDSAKDQKGEQVIGQFCLSTLAFDQVLTVTIPILKSYSFNPVQMLKTITENLLIQKGRCLN